MAENSCSWTKMNQEDIEAHPAWKGDIDVREAERLLKGSGPFSYLLRNGEEENAYLATFVKGDGSIKHQRFTLEYDREGWYLRNGCTGSGPEDIVSPTLAGLIPEMLHCSAEECRIV